LYLLYHPAYDFVSTYNNDTLETVTTNPSLEVDLPINSTLTIKKFANSLASTPDALF
jgi:hypothetical protein